MSGSGSGSGSGRSDSSGTETGLVLREEEEEEVFSSTEEGEEEEDDTTCVDFSTSSSTSSTPDSRSSNIVNEKKREKGKREGPPEQLKCVALFVRQTRRVHRLIERLFSGLAGVSFDQPLVVMFLMVLLAVTCGVGLALTINVVSKGDQIYVPQESDSILARDRIKELWGNADATVLLLARSRDFDDGDGGDASATSGPDALTRDILTELMTFHTRLLALTADYDGEKDALTWDNMCYRAVGQTECYFTGPLLWWGYNQTRIDSTASSLHQQLTPFTPTSDGAGVIGLDRIFAGYDQGEDFQASENVKSMILIYRIDDNDEKKRVVFEEAILEMIADMLGASYDGGDADDPDAIFKETNIYYFSTSSLDNELSRAVGQDIPLFGGAITLMFIYSGFALSRWNLRETKFLVALAGTLSVLLAIISAYGTASSFGVIFTSLTGILPFILVGIGVDDMFVMVDEVYYRQEWPSPQQLALLEKSARRALLREKFCEGVGAAGAAITVTSLTNAMAFFLGAITVIPATKAFCIYAGLGVMFDFAFQTTFFAACVSLDVRRMAANRIEILPCVRAPEKSPDEDAVVASKKLDKKNEESTCSKKQPLRGMLRVYSKYLFRWTWARPAILVVFVILTILAAIGASQLERGLPLEDLAPDDSYIIPFQTALLEDYNGFPGTAQIVIDEDAFDFSPLEVQKNLEQLTLEVENTEFGFGSTGFTRSWIRQLSLFVNATRPQDIVRDPDCPDPGCVSSARFYANLGAYVATPGTRAKLGELIVLRDGPVTSKNAIKGSRVLVSLDGLGDEASRVRALTKFKEIWFEYNPKDGETILPILIFADFFVFVESDLVQLQETLTTLGLAVVSVSTVATVLLVHPALGMYVALCILMIDAWLFGWMFMFGIRFNAISVTNLVMAIGIAFDFVGHIAHGYINNAHWQRKLKVQHALTHMGVPVMNAALTTFLGVMLLAAARSTAFRIFFQMFLGIVLSSVVFSFLFLPALLGYVGPQMKIED